jgi:hypothetical protein
MAYRKRTQGLRELCQQFWDRFGFVAIVLAVRSALPQSGGLFCIGEPTCDYLIRTEFFETGQGRELENDERRKAKGHGCR